MPDWMQSAARFNPVDWGVKAARDAVVTGGNWGSVGLYLALLVALVGVTSGFATWTFRSYQRSL
jgi:ABC-2 type transport system permease protein